MDGTVHWNLPIQACVYIKHIEYIYIYCLSMLIYIFSSISVHRFGRECRFIRFLSIQHMYVCRNETEAVISMYANKHI